RSDACRPGHQSHKHVRSLRLSVVKRSGRMDFFFVEWLGTPVWFWLAFLSLVVALTAFDLGILHKDDSEIGIGESLKLSAFYISVALLFGAWVWHARGSEAGMQYFTGFFIEKALSIDNVFVISLIFTYFAIPPKY